MDYKRAETAYLEAIKIDSKQPKAYLKLADVYVADGQADKAIKILNKGLKNVDKDDQKEITEKKKKIEKQTQNQDVINNGGNHVTYNGKTYYWKYSSDGLYSAPMHAMYFGNYIRFENDIENELICLDKNGKEETIYEGIGYGKLWIYNQRIYSKKADTKLFSIKLDGTDEKSYDDIYEINAVCDNGLIVSTSNYKIGLLKKEAKEIEVIKEDVKYCYFEDNKIYYQEFVCLDSTERNFGSIDINGENDDDLRASQALVVSSDGIHFDNVKNKKQIIPMIQEAYLGDYRHTRDPKIWKKQDGKYAMVIGSKVAYENDYCGKALFYESEDGIHFEYKNSYQEPTIGNMWECPDVFKINDQFFMIFSPENTDQPPKPNSNARYMPIDFDEDTLTIKDHGDWPYLDHGLDFYAPQTFLSKDNERILLGWLRMRKPVQGEEWVGMFIMPRVLKEKEGLC